jgi:heme-degrading monooxygenase HmoA
MPLESTYPQKKGDAAVGINVFETPRARHDELIETLGAIAETAEREGLPKNIGSAFHRALEAPIVVNYVQYTDPSGGKELTAVAKPLVDLTHEIATGHEMRWYTILDVVNAGSSADSFNIVADRNTVSVISVYRVEPDKRLELLEALTSYAGVVKSADGFKVMAILRGHKAEHAASYEAWTSEAAYRRAIEGGARVALQRIHGTATQALVHSYECVRANHHI